MKEAINIKINIYCDESCYLEHDHQSKMVLGAIRCAKVYKKQIVNDIRAIKKRYHMNPFCELKWTKVSFNKLALYKEIIIYFFTNPHLTFRAVIIDKNKLKHFKFHQSHDDFYYKMYYQLLIRSIIPDHENHIYLDIKDTKSTEKVKKLNDILASGIYDFDKKYIKNIQNINSKESELLQLTDMLIGAISYLNRDEHRKVGYSKAKMALIKLISQYSGYNLRKSTFISENKFNLFFMDLQ